MPQYGVAITKRVSFRGVNQEFTNVYHYNGATLTVANGDALAAALKAIEVGLHSSDVTFVRYKVWTSGGTPSQNNMLTQGALSGTGSQAGVSDFDRERAILVRFRAGNDSRGHPVYLRKWYHSCGGCAGYTPSAAALQQTAQIPQANRDAIVAAADDVLLMTVGGNPYNLVAESGRAGGTPVECHAWLEHHQLGDMWR